MKISPVYGFSLIIAGALIAGIAGLALAHPNDSQSPSPAPTSYAVTIKGFAFSPKELTVPVGATVVWKNEDSAAHTATSSVPGFDSGNLDQGQSYSFTFKKAGKYPYVCSYHSNMTATIVVQDSD